MAAQTMLPYQNNGRAEGWRPCASAHCVFYLPTVGEFKRF